MIVPLYEAAFERVLDLREDLESLPAIMRAGNVHRATDPSLERRLRKAVAHFERLWCMYHSGRPIPIHMRAPLRRRPT